GAEGNRLGRATDSQPLKPLGENRDRQLVNRTLAEFGGERVEVSLVEGVGAGLGAGLYVRQEARPGIGNRLGAFGRGGGLRAGCNRLVPRGDGFGSVLLPADPETDPPPVHPRIPAVLIRPIPRLRLTHGRTPCDEGKGTPKGTQGRERCAKWLGFRFVRNEEVESSNLFRSTRRTRGRPPRVSRFAPRRTRRFRAWPGVAGRAELAPTTLPHPRRKLTEQPPAGKEGSCDHRWVG